MGITKFLIQEGIARLEEVRDEHGALADLYIRVSVDLPLHRFCD